MSIKRKKKKHVLLQEFHFNNALKEHLIEKENDFAVNHKIGECINGGIKYSIIFPPSRINMINDIGNKTKKSLKYFYQGFMTKKKNWILEFKKKDDSFILESNYGRNIKKKYSLDAGYFEKMNSSLFCLCPTDIYPWSYRFFEAILCKAIPILSDNETDKFSHRFKFYRESDEHVYREDWVKFNQKQLNKFNTIKNNWYEYPMWQEEFSKHYDKKIINKNSSHYMTNNNNIYNNALVCSPECDKDYWHSILAVCKETKKIITHSNHFLTTINKFQDINHKIYDRITFTYHHILNSKNDDHVLIEGECFLLANSFVAVNSGHDLSIILDSVDYIRKNPTIKNIIILKSSDLYPNNLNLLKLLLIDMPQKLIYIDQSQVYKFIKLHVIPREYVNIMKHTYLFNELKDKIKPHYSLKNKNPKRVLLLKCNRNNQVTRRDTSLICEKMINFLEEKYNFVYLNPETIHIYKLANILMTAEVIISSWGGILYTNMGFYNANANIKLILLKKQKVNKHWFHVTKHANKIIYGKHNNLDINNIENNRIIMEILKDIDDIKKIKNDIKFYFQTKVNN